MKEEKDLSLNTGDDVGDLILSQLDQVHGILGTSNEQVW